MILKEKGEIMVIEIQEERSMGGWGRSGIRKKIPNSKDV